MGILGRINTVIKSNINDVLDKMTDPAKEIDLVIHDMLESEKKAKAELVDSIAAVKRTEKKVAPLKEEVDRWLERARKAVAAGDDDLAREALQEKAIADKQVEDMEKILAEQETYADQLRRSLKGLSLKIKEVQAKAGMLKEKTRAVKRGGSALDGKGGAFADFARLEDRIESFETEVELTGQLDGKDLETEAKFRKLEGERKDPKVEDELAALKKRLEEGGEEGGG